MTSITLSELPGLTVGHQEDRNAKTGCTAILCPAGAVASAFVPGFAPGVRELDLLRPESLVPAIHGLTLAGGSAFGLAAATGVVRFLREKGAGFATGPIRVPIVPAAVIYDYPANLSNGALPDEAMGYAAAVNASSAPALSGPLGAGFSAASGLLGGPNGASPSGLGSFGEARPNGLKVAALVVVNSLGSVVNPQTGAIVSGLISSKGGLATRSEILGVLEKSPPTRPGQTVLAVVATNAPLDKLNAFRLARMACCGLSRAIFPAHLMFDGDVVFALSLGSGPEANISYLGALAAEILSEAILRSVP